MRPHLSETDIETLVASPESTDSATEEHASLCAECGAALASARADYAATTAALSAWSPGFDAAALARSVAASHAAHPSVAVTSAASLASLALFAVLTFVRDAVPSPGALRGALLTAAKVALRAQAAFEPLVWLALSVAALTAFAFVFFATDRYAGTVRKSLVLGALLLLAPSPARALDLEGEWPESELVTLHVDDAPVVDALRAIANELHVGLVVAVGSTERVTVHLDNVPSRAAFEAIAGDSSWRAVRSNGVVSIRPVVATAPAQPANTERASTAEHTASDERVAFGGDVVIRAGERVRDAAAFGGSVDVAGDVDGDVVAFGGDVRIRCGASVHGDIEAVGGRVVRDECGETVRTSGNRALEPEGERAEVDEEEESLLDDLASDLQSLVFVFFLGVVFMHFRPVRYRAAIDLLRAAPLRTAGLGVLASFATTIGVVVLAITIIGIPLAVVATLTAVVVGYLGAAVVAGTLGSLLPMERLRQSPVLELLAGTCVWFVLLRLPGAGVLASVAGWLAAVGALLLVFRKREAV